MPKVLISDKMDALAEQTFKENNIDVDFKPGLSPEELKKIIGEYDGLAIRSSTKVTEDILSSATNLKVVGRAGIGVDNIDIPKATEAGVIVMNTPFGNAITTAEHAIAMMFAVARDIPQASSSTHAGKWEKSKFMGVELYGKTLGLIGCGNIGSIVANRAVGLKMKVLAFDPFLTKEKAIELGVERVELEEIWKRSDFITLHVPKTDQTKNMINKDTIAQMKDGVRLVNCARGGLINEADLKDALDSGKVAGAALDVFEVEPAKENVLFGHEKVVCTPHLGASTKEAQVNVAIQVAEQISDYLNAGAVTNALNMPSISAEDAPKLKPYVKLAEDMGSMAGQITATGIKAIRIEYLGAVSLLNTKPLTAAIIAAVLKPMMEGVNMVSAPMNAKSRGIEISETKTENAGGFETAIKVTLETEARTRSTMGTLFADGEARIVNIESVPIEAAVSPNMLFIRNEDKPGLIGNLGSLLGDAGINIADFRLGRRTFKRRKGDENPESIKEAVALVSIDSPIGDDLFAKIEALPSVTTAKRLVF
jgi:D-3-phosphoglycerate dehydrogenase